jgi:hypothetical protein
MTNYNWLTRLLGRGPTNPKLQDEDFYLEEGNMVLTEHYHLRRGKCCDNGCKHCPYKKQDGNKQTNI